MHDVVLVEHLKCFKQLFENEKGLFFREHPLSFEHAFKSSSVTIFVDKIEIVGGFEHVDVLDDMVMFLDVGENIDLVDSALFEFFVFFKPADLNDFDSVLFRVELVGGSVDLSVGSFADNFVKSVVFDDSNHLIIKK